MRPFKADMALTRISYKHRTIVEETTAYLKFQLVFPQHFDFTAPQRRAIEVKFDHKLNQAVSDLPDPFIRPPITTKDIHYIYHKPNLYLFGDRIFPIDIPFPVLYAFLSNLDWGDKLMAGFFGIEKEDPDFFFTHWPGFRGSIEIRRPADKILHWYTKGKLIGLYTVESNMFCIFQHWDKDRTVAYFWDQGCFPMSQFTARAVEKILFLIKYPAASTIEIVVSRIEKFILSITASQAAREETWAKLTAEQKAEIYRIAENYNFQLDDDPG
ncbi:hypothetical protein ACFL27_11505 [candidate division CSSED10-310 bacterium]|uniref:Uncharacterized protein n=1 Tax=candidate division CSSED10-310 bacterium TaxID=2855610 RepID=A0ABV6YX99_UNCC1